MTTDNQQFKLPPREWYTLEQAVKRIKELTNQDVTIDDLIHYWHNEQLNFVIYINFLNTLKIKLGTNNSNTDYILGNIGKQKIKASDFYFFLLHNEYELKKYNNYRNCYIGDFTAIDKNKLEEYKKNFQKNKDQLSKKLEKITFKKEQAKHEQNEEEILHLEIEERYTKSSIFFNSNEIKELQEEIEHIKHFDKNFFNEKIISPFEVEGFLYIDSYEKPNPYELNNTKININDIILSVMKNDEPDFINFDFKAKKDIYISFNDVCILNEELEDFLQGINKRFELQQIIKETKSRDRIGRKSEQGKEKIIRIMHNIFKENPNASRNKILDYVVDNYDWVKETVKGYAKEEEQAGREIGATKNKKINLVIPKKDYNY